MTALLKELGWRVVAPLILLVIVGLIFKNIKPDLNWTNWMIGGATAILIGFLIDWRRGKLKKRLAR